MAVSLLLEQAQRFPSGQRHGKSLTEEAAGFKSFQGKDD